MKVLVTGGAGFIGSHIVDLLLEEDYGDSWLPGKYIDWTKEQPEVSNYYADAEKVMKQEGVLKTVRS